MIRGIVVFGLFIAACTEKPENAATQSARDLVAAVQNIIRAQTCAPSVSPGCIDSALTLGTAAGSVFRYFPGAKDPATGVQHYWVMSRDANGETGRPAFLGDDYGQVFEARYNPRWDQLGPDSVAMLLFLRTPVGHLRATYDCIRSNYASYLGEYPEDLSHANRRELCIPGSVFEVDQGNRVGSAKFAINYVASANDPRLGYPKSFSLHARPVTYGVASVRSFLVDTVGDVHFSNENRAASMTDPLVFGCEGHDVSYDCSVSVARSVGLTGSRH